MRRSEDIVSIWEEILIDTQADLGEERWMILEQVRLVCQLILIMRNKIIYFVQGSKSITFHQCLIKHIRLLLLPWMCIGEIS